MATFGELMNMKKLLILKLAIVALMIGCTTPQPNVKLQNPIVEEHFAMYTNSVNVSHVKLSSMFKYYLEGDMSDSWDEVGNHLNEYVHQATSQYVNVNYPVKATVAEGTFLKDLGEDVIEYSHDKDMGSNTYRSSFKTIAVGLIKRMNNYEYDRHR